jgi:hypothetical protein
MVSHHMQPRYTFFNGDTLHCSWRDGLCPEFSARQAAILTRLGLPSATAAPPLSSSARAAASVDSDHIAAVALSIANLMISVPPAAALVNPPDV